MGTRSKYIHHSENYYKKLTADRNERNHLPGHKFIRLVDSMEKKQHRRITVGWKKADDLKIDPMRVPIIQ